MQSSIFRLESDGGPRGEEHSYSFFIIPLIHISRSHVGLPLELLYLAMRSPPSRVGVPGSAQPSAASRCISSIASIPKIISMNLFHCTCSLSVRRAPWSERRQQQQRRNDNNDNTGAKWHEKRVGGKLWVFHLPFLYRTSLIGNGVAAAAAATRAASAIRS